MATKFNIKEKLRVFEQKKRTVLPAIIANATQNYFVKSFADQGFDGTLWKEVKRRIMGENAYKYPMGWGLSRRTNDILVGGGNNKGQAGGTLRREVADSIKEKTFEKIRIAVAVPYAAYNNFGTENITARPFIKDSPRLRAIHKQKINEFVNGIFGTR